MTDQEFVKALEEFIKEEGKRPPEEQVRGLIEAGVIDNQGRVLIGNGQQSDTGKKSTGARRKGQARRRGTKREA
jgi:hypothetical protein